MSSSVFVVVTDIVVVVEMRRLQTIAWSQTFFVVVVDRVDVEGAWLGPPHWMGSFLRHQSIQSDGPFPLPHFVDYLPDRPRTKHRPSFPG